MDNNIIQMAVGRFSMKQSNFVKYYYCNEFDPYGCLTNEGLSATKIPINYDSHDSGA